MTYASVQAACAALDPDPLWSISRYDVGDTRSDYPLSRADFSRDQDWAGAVLRGLGVTSADLICFVGSHAAWYEPFIETARSIGATMTFAESSARDGRRIEMVARRLPLTMIVGLSAEAVTAMSALCDVGERLAGVSQILADEAAIAPLAEAGVAARRLLRLGPAVAVECPGKALHVNAEEWRVEPTASGLTISTVGPRAHWIQGEPLSRSGAVRPGPCGCGIPGDLLDLAVPG
jgi:hypothetical protein